MKISKLTGLMKKEIFVTLMQDEEAHEQWVRIGDGIYSLNKLPWLEDVEMLLTILDLSEKERDKLHLDERGKLKGVNLDDADPKERHMPMVEINIKIGDMELIPVRTSVGLRFFKKSYLAPIEDVTDKILMERQGANGLPYIAVKQGLMLQAIIVPLSYSETKLPEELETMHTEMISTLSYEAKQREGLK